MEYTGYLLTRYIYTQIPQTIVPLYDVIEDWHFRSCVPIVLIIPHCSRAVTRE